MPTREIDSDPSLIVPTVDAGLADLVVKPREVWSPIVTPAVADPAAPASVVWKRRIVMATEEFGDPEELPDPEEEIDQEEYASKQLVADVQVEDNSCANKVRVFYTHHSWNAGGRTLGYTDESNQWASTYTG
jgi:hypothetical protein